MLGSKIQIHVQSQKFQVFQVQTTSGGIIDILEIVVITLTSFYMISEATKPEQ